MHKSVFLLWGFHVCVRDLTHTPYLEAASVEQLGLDNYSGLLIKLITSTKNAMFLVWFACLLVIRIMEKPLARFPWNLVQKCRMRQGRTHYILKLIWIKGRIQKLFFYFHLHCKIRHGLGRGLYSFALLVLAIFSISYDIVPGKLIAKSQFNCCLARWTEVLFFLKCAHNYSKYGRNLNKELGLYI